MPGALIGKTITRGRVIFFGVRIRLGTILGRFSIIYFRGLGLRVRVSVMVRFSVVLWSVNLGLGSEFRLG